MEVLPLSSTYTPDYNFNLGNVSLAVVERFMDNGMSLSQPIAFESIKSFKHKNFSNVYLTDSLFVNDIVDYNKNIEENKENTKLVTINYGSNALSFTPFKRDINYGVASFANSKNFGYNTILDIDFLDDNYCRISYTDTNNRKYYLSSDEDNKLVFVSVKILPDTDGYVNPHDFTYISSDNGTRISIFKETSTGSFLLTKINDDLAMVVSTSQLLINYFTINRVKTNDKTINLNSCIVSYKDGYFIDQEKSFFDLKNNFLLFKKPYKNINDVEMLILKNQLSEYESFSNTNILLSGNGKNISTNRDYISISNNISEKNDHTLSLNYSHYQKSYMIKSGTNEFTTPDNMYPFDKININDLNFIKSGAFSSTIPLFADKIYRVSPYKQNSDNGQYLLCTWLSGSPLSDKKIWVDRYYYPDLVTKEQAISGNPIFQITYENVIEDLIRNNSEYKEKTIKLKFFDKLSDMLFEPTIKYIYERVKFDNVVGGVDSYDPCADFPNNYFLEINDIGKFSITFDFYNKNSNFELISDRNEIDCGLYISCVNNLITLSYNVIDPVNNIEKLIEESNISVDNNANIFVCVSIDSINGVGYFYVNDKIVKFFNFSPYIFTRKQIIYGDLYYTLNGSSTKNYIKNSNDVGDIKNLTVYKDYIEPDYAFMINNSNLSVDDLVIYLPCGLRNSTDEIKFLNSVIGSSVYKSNNINLEIYNLDVSDEIENNIKSLISENISEILPPNNEIEDINFNPVIY